MLYRRWMTAIVLMLPVWLWGVAPSSESGPPDGRLSLVNGLAAFTPPPEEAGWELHRTVKNTQNAVRGARYIVRGQASLQVQLNPGAAPKKPGDAKHVREGMAQDIQILYRKMGSAKNSKIEVITEAKVLDDPRFFLAVESTYKQDGHEHVCLRLFNNLPPHLLSVTLVTRAEDKEAAAKAREAAEQVALSGQLLPRGQKAPPAPDAPALGKPGGKPEDDDDLPAAAANVQEAQKALSEAAAKAEVGLLNKPEYARAKKAADDAEARLKELRAKEPPDRAAIARASTDWMEAKGRVEKMRKEALDKDPAVVEARRKLAEARKQSSGK